MTLLMMALISNKQLWLTSWCWHTYSLIVKTCINIDIFFVDFLLILHELNWANTIPSPFLLLLPRLPLLNQLTWVCLQAKWTSISLRHEIQQRMNHTDNSIPYNFMIVCGIPLQQFISCFLHWVLGHCVCIFTQHSTWRGRDTIDWRQKSSIRDRDLLFHNPSINWPLEWGCA